MNLQNAIDLDQAEIQRLLASGTNQDYLQAQMIYKEGAFSKSVATVTLDAVLTAPISKGAAITGDAMDGTKVEGTVFAAAKAGDQDLRIQYNVSPVQSSYVGCQVGANPNPVTDGCFLKTGSLVIGGFATPFPYSYEPEENNDNERTIQGFSTSAETKMRRSEDSPYYLTYQKFYDYYGRFDYADHWVLSAFAGGATSFPTQNGNADFSTFEEKGRVGKFLIPKIRTTLTVVCLLMFSNVLSLLFCRGHQERDRLHERLDVCDSRDGRCFG